MDLESAEYLNAFNTVKSALLKTYNVAPEFLISKIMHMFRNPTPPTGTTLSELLRNNLPSEQNAATASNMILQQVKG